jgi:hypothetical protein
LAGAVAAELGAAKTESNQSQPVPACAVPDTLMNAATAAINAAGLAICLKAVIGKLLFRPLPNQAGVIPNESTQRKKTTPRLRPAQLTTKER